MAIPSQEHLSSQIRAMSDSINSIKSMLQNQVKQLEDLRAQFDQHYVQIPTQSSNTVVSNPSNAPNPLPPPSSAVRRVNSVNDVMYQEFDPHQIIQSGKKLWSVSYRILLWRYQKRERRPYRHWENHMIYIAGEPNETRADIIAKAAARILYHWDVQAINGVEVEVPFEYLGITRQTAFDANNLALWLTIVAENVHELTGADDLDAIPAYGKSWKYKMLDELNKHEFKLREGHCWIDYLTQKLCGRPGFKTLTKPKLEKQLLQITGKTTGFTNNDIINWIKSTRKPISLYCLSPTYEIKTVYTPSTRRNRTNRITLCYLLNNGHIYPLENDKLFASLGQGHMTNITHFDDLNPTNLFKHRSNFTNFAMFDSDNDNINHFISGLYKLDKDVIYFDNRQYQYGTVLCKIIDETGYAVEAIRPYEMSFIHPVSGQKYQGVFDYNERKKMCKEIYNVYQTINFQWSNQTITQMAKKIFQIEHGAIPLSYHTDLAIKMLDDFAPMPWSMRCDTCQFPLDHQYHVDIKKCYASMTVNRLNKYKLPMYTILDNIELFQPSQSQLKCGLYLVQEFTIQKYKLLSQTQWMPHFEVQYLLDKGFITNDNISHQYIAKYWFDGAIFGQFVEYLFNTFDIKTANALWHHFYGSLNTKKRKENVAFITNDFKMVLAYWKEYLGAVSFEPISWTDSMHSTACRWLVQRRVSERTITDNVGLYCCMTGGGHIELLEMLDKLWIDNMVLTAVRTDSVYLQLDNDIHDQFQTKLNKYIKNANIPDDATFFEKLRLEPYRIEDDWNPPMWKYVLRPSVVDLTKYDLSLLEMQQFDPDKDYTNTNFLEHGPGGVNKTGDLVGYHNNWLDKGKKAKAVSLTNVAKVNLINRGIDPSRVSTLALLLGQNQSNFIKETSNDFDLLSIDEFSMISDKMWHKIKIKQQKSKCKLHIFGDVYQCSAVEGKVKYDVRKTQFLRELLGPDGLILEKKYKKIIDPVTKLPIEGRCDEKIRAVVNAIMRDPQHRFPTLLLTPQYNWLWTDSKTAKCHTMICKYRNKPNKTVAKLNARLNTHIKSGCRVICNENSKKLDIWNGERYIVQQIRDKQWVDCYKWEANPADRNKKREYKCIPLKYLTLANAETVQKYQGMTLYEDVIIFEPHRMQMEDFLTAITRARKLSQIKITNKAQLQNKCFRSVYDIEYFEQMDLQPSLVEFSLYSIIDNKTQRCYVGITELDHKERFLQHKERKDCACKDFDFDDCTVELIGKFYAQNKEDNQIETMYIDDYKKHSQYTVVNTRQNNYKIDIISQTLKNNQSKTPKKTQSLDTIDLTKKLQIHCYEKGDEKYWYFHDGKSQPKARYGKRFTKEQAKAKIEQKRKDRLKIRFPHCF